MVNTQHIHTFLSSYIQYSKEDIITLENLAENETLYSLVNVALLKAYHQNNEKEKYEKLLPKVALMVPDRSVLKKHIEDIVIKEILKEEIKTIVIPEEKINEFSRHTEILEETIPEQEDIVENPRILEENIVDETVEEIHEFSNETREDSEDILEENPDEHVEEIKEFLKENESVPDATENDESEIILKENLTETSEILEENSVEKIHEFSNEETETEESEISEEIESEIVLEEIPVEKIH